MERARDGVRESEREKDTTAPTLITLWDCCVCVYIYFFYFPCRRSAVPFQCEALARVRPARVYFPRLRRLTKLRSRHSDDLRRSHCCGSEDNDDDDFGGGGGDFGVIIIVALFFYFTSPVVIGDTAVIIFQWPLHKSADNSQVRPQHHIVRQCRGGIFVFIRVKVS